MFCKSTKMSLPLFVHELSQQHLRVRSWQTVLGPEDTAESSTWPCPQVVWPNQLLLFSIHKVSSDTEIYFTWKSVGASISNTKQRHPFDHKQQSLWLVSPAFCGRPIPLHQCLWKHMLTCPLLAPLPHSAYSCLLPPLNPEELRKCLVKEWVLDWRTE